MDDTVAANGAANTNPITTYIGNDPSTGGRSFAGLIDDVRIYNRALSAAQILTMYNAGK